MRIGFTYTSELVKKEIGKWAKIREGLHTFAYREPVKRMSHTITQCIIPKGAKYYVGSYNDHKAYASDTLKYIKILE